MEKSIETIWTKGFLTEEELTAPKINNLYRKKSRLLIEKLRRTYRIDNKSILPLAILAVVGFSVAGHIILGVYIMTLMLFMFFLNKKMLTSLESISINSTSYDYLLEYRKMFFQLKKFYIRLLGLGLPVAGMVGYYLFFRNSLVLHDFLQLDPVYIMGIILGIAVALSALGISAYLLSLKVVYGRFIQKLDEMIADMEELRK